MAADPPRAARRRHPRDPGVEPLLHRRAPPLRARPARSLPAEPPPGAAQRGRRGRRLGRPEHVVAGDPRRSRGRGRRRRVARRRPGATAADLPPVPVRTHRPLLRRRRGGAARGGDHGRRAGPRAGRAVAPTAGGGPRLGQPPGLGRAHRPRDPAHPVADDAPHPDRPRRRAGRRPRPAGARRGGRGGGGRRPRGPAHGGRAGIPALRRRHGRPGPGSSLRGAGPTTALLPHLLRRRRAHLADGVPAGAGRRPRLGAFLGGGRGPVRVADALPRRRLRGAAAPRRPVLPRARGARRRAGPGADGHGSPRPRRRLPRRRRQRRAAGVRPAGPTGRAHRLLRRGAARARLVPAAARAGAAGLAGGEGRPARGTAGRPAGTPALRAGSGGAPARGGRGGRRDGRRPGRPGVVPRRPGRRRGDALRSHHGGAGGGP